MEEIKVGEYVRSKYGTLIKVGWVGRSIVIDEFDNITLSKTGGEIVKHSSNIIDLIEEGDYVNEYRVEDIMEDLDTGEIHLEMPMDYTNKELGDCTIYNKDIKSVVTKEQFNQMKYIVGE